MRSVYLKTLMLTLVVIGLWGSLPNIHAQTLLMDWNQTWKYWANTNNYTTNSPVPTWCSTNFNDAAWPSRQGLIYAENDPGTGETLGGVYGGSPSLTGPALSTSTNGVYIQTYYFRTHFTYTGPNTTNVVLQLERFVDDGAVFYLNGRELPGTRVLMPTTAVNWSTSATGTTYGDPATPVTNTVIVSSLSVADLRVGDNVLAVEVHQSGGSSSDMVFGMRLLSRPTLPPTIVSNFPPTLVAYVESGSNVVLNVTAAGDTPLSYQWRRGTNSGPQYVTNNIAGQTAATYSFVATPAPTSLGSNRIGYFTVVVTNAFGRVTSSVFTVQVYVRNLQITLQPTNQTADVGYTNVTMSVQVNGTQPNFQWQTNTLLTGLGTWVNIFGATSSNYVIASVTTNHTRLYRCMITNWNGAIYSSNALLLVYPDLTGPTLVSAIADEEASNRAPYRVTVRFSETMTVSSASTITNYVINLVGTSLTMNVTNARGSGNSFQLFVDGLKLGSNYVLTVNNVRDSRNNVIAPNSQIGLTFTTNTLIFLMGQQSWRHFEGIEPFVSGDIESYFDEAHKTAWRTNYFEPPVPLFAEGLALWFYDNDPLPEVCDGTPQSPVSLGLMTYYFTTKFTVPPVDSRSRFELRSVVDDGAVYYLNGMEIFRYNMPAWPTPIHYGTNASGGIGNAECVTNYFTVENLVSGTNILTVEVHQNDVLSTDLAFGAELYAKLNLEYVVPEPTNAPLLSIRRQANNVNMSWTGNGYALVYATSITGPWEEVQPDMANPYTTSAAAAGRKFYRLVRKQF